MVKTPTLKRKIFFFIILCFFSLVLLWYSANAFFSKSDPDKISNDQKDVPLQTLSEFVLFTMPKTGTHLVRPILEHLTNKSSISYWSKEISCPKSYLYDKNMTNLLLLLPKVIQVYWLHQPIQKSLFLPILDSLQEDEKFFVTHAPYSTEMENILKERQCTVFFLIRDPRDWVISVINHPLISGLDIYGAPFKDEYFLSLDFNQKINYVIEGTSKYYSAREVHNKFLSWRGSSICCTLRFEALLGPRGGASSEKEQIAELRKIANSLHLDVSDEMLIKFFDASFAQGALFSKGKAGVWKDYFNLEHKARFKECLGDVLIELGYENDYNW